VLELNDFIGKEHNEPLQILSKNDFYCAVVGARRRAKNELQRISNTNVALIPGGTCFDEQRDETRKARGTQKKRYLL